MARDIWTEDQITVVLYEYCRNPFGQFSETKPFVKELGLLLGRTPGAIVRKVGNLASFDPQMKARGDEGPWFGLDLNNRLPINVHLFFLDRIWQTICEYCERDADGEWNHYYNSNIYCENVIVKYIH